MGRSATWLGAALALGLTTAACAPLTELPRPPAVSTLTAPELPPPALAPEPEPAAPLAEPAVPVAGPAPVAAPDPEPAFAPEPVTAFEETLAAFEAPVKPLRPAKKKRKREED